VINFWADVLPQDFPRIFLSTPQSRSERIQENGSAVMLLVSDDSDPPAVAGPRPATA
jgi:hypothetical protein